jgi:hypothetical protein
MNYFLQFWDENRDDEYSSWGTSTWYFETNDVDNVLKQITIYKNGKIVKYSEDKLKDELGMLCDQTLTIDDCDGDEITKKEFYKLWS